MKKRVFLKQVALGSITASSLFKSIAKTIEHFENEETPLAMNDGFWEKIRNHYQLKKDYINLEGGYYCMLPEQNAPSVQKAYRYVNREASYYMRNVQWENKNRVAAKLAEMAGCSAQELIITRNTTESLDLIIGGYPSESWR